MSGKSELKKIKEAAEEFAEALSREDRISIIAFDDEVYRALDWTDDMKKVRKALGKLRPGVRTALYDAMYFAANEQLKGIEGRKAIILLTDCVNNQSRVSFRDASLSIVQSQASLYVVSKTAIVKEQAKRERRVIMISDILKRLFGDDEDYIDEFFKKREGEMSDLVGENRRAVFFPDRLPVSERYLCGGCPGAEKQILPDLCFQPDVAARFLSSDFHRISGARKQSRLSQRLLSSTSARAEVSGNFE